ncbi:hypothetical protein FG05_30396 [Fusarium graminearum]|nr:hypothetical protein FG05_30396 [Fusarium graminearum]
MGSALFKLLPDKNRENELLNRIRIRENLHLDPSKRQIDCIDITVGVADRSLRNRTLTTNKETKSNADPVSAL